MDREQWEPIHVTDAKHEAMRCTHYLFDQAGGRHPQWFNLKSYPREYRKRGNAMFDFLHQKVKRQLQASKRKRKARADGTQHSTNGASIRYSETDSDDPNEDSNAPNVLEPEQGAPPKVSDHTSSWSVSPDPPNNRSSSELVDIPIEAECKCIHAYHL